MEITYNELNKVLISFGFKDISTPKHCIYFHKASDAFIGLPINLEVLDAGHVAMVTHTLWGYGFIKERAIFYKIIEKIRLEAEIAAHILV